jgi:hypothetical protein
LNHQNASRSDDLAFFTTINVMLFTRNSLYANFSLWATSQIAEPLIDTAT